MRLWSGLQGVKLSNNFVRLKLCQVDGTGMLPFSMLFDIIITLCNFSIFFFFYLLFSFLSRIIIISRDYFLIDFFTAHH